MPSNAIKRVNASRALPRSATGRASIACLSGWAMPGASNIFFSLAANVVVWSYCMAIRLRVSCLPTPASSAKRSPRSGADQELDSCMP
ncbi:hypothetical protein D3C87_1476930 [compost metagenome]